MNEFNRTLVNEADQILLQKAKGGDKDAFASLIRLHTKGMYKTAVAILRNDADAADAIQDTILAVWENLGSLKKPEFFRTWMTRILINKCRDIRRESTMFVPLEAAGEPAYRDESNLELKEAIEYLDEKYSLIMVLYYSEGYSIAEIAKILHIPKSTVQTRLQRGRKKLADYYNDSARITSEKRSSGDDAKKIPYCI